MIKPVTEIRNLKIRVKELEQLCSLAGVPLLLVMFPQLVFKRYKQKPTKVQVKWVKEKIKEYKEKFKK